MASFVSRIATTAAESVQDLGNHMLLRRAHSLRTLPRTQAPVDMCDLMDPRILSGHKFTMLCCFVLAMLLCLARVPPPDLLPPLCCWFCLMCVLLLVCHAHVRAHQSTYMFHRECVDHLFVLAGLYMDRLILPRQTLDAATLLAGVWQHMTLDCLLSFSFVLLVRQYDRLGFNLKFLGYAGSSMNTMTSFALSVATRLLTQYTVGYKQGDFLSEHLPDIVCVVIHLFISEGMLVLQHDSSRMANAAFHLLRKNSGGERPEFFVLTLLSLHVVMAEERLAVTLCVALAWAALFVAVREEYWAGYAFVLRSMQAEGRLGLPGWAHLSCCVNAAMYVIEMPFNLTASWYCETRCKRADDVSQDVQPPVAPDRSRRLQRGLDGLPTWSAATAPPAWSVASPISVASSVSTPPASHTDSQRTVPGASRTMYASQPASQTVYGGRPWIEPPEESPPTARVPCPPLRTTSLRNIIETDKASYSTRELLWNCTGVARQEASDDLAQLFHTQENPPSLRPVRWLLYLLFSCAQWGWLRLLQASFVVQGVLAGQLGVLVLTIALFGLMVSHRWVGMGMGGLTVLGRLVLVHNTTARDRLVQTLQRTIPVIQAYAGMAKANEGFQLATARAHECTDHSANHLYFVCRSSLCTNATHANCVRTMRAAEMFMPVKNVDWGAVCGNDTFVRALCRMCSECEQVRTDVDHSWRKVVDSRDVVLVRIEALQDEADWPNVTLDDSLVQSVVRGSWGAPFEYKAILDFVLPSQTVPAIAATPHTFSVASVQQNALAPYGGGGAAVSLAKMGELIVSLLSPGVRLAEQEKRCETVQINRDALLRVLAIGRVAERSVSAVLPLWGASLTHQAATAVTNGLETVIVSQMVLDAAQAGEWLYPDAVQAAPDAPDVPVQPRSASGVFLRIMYDKLADTVRVTYRTALLPAKRV